MTVEQVFVVRRAEFFGGVWPQGFTSTTADGEPLLERMLAQGFFVDRPEAEREPEWKQLIPYCVLRRPDQVFCVQRKAAQTETRLHHLLSIGLGGHVNPGLPTDSAAGFFAAALRQELDEELAFFAAGGPDAPPIATPDSARLCGLLNDDGTEVGRVHCGLVYALDLPAPGPSAPVVRVREVSKMAGGFRHLAELEGLWQDPARFESWSRILFQAGLAGPIAVSRLQRTRSAPPEGVERNENG